MLIYLECTHSLCRNCLSKLQAHQCPFCRTNINKDTSLKQHYSSEPEITEFIPIRIRSRYKHISDSINIGNRSLIIKPNHTSKRNKKSNSIKRQIHPRKN